MTFALWKKPIGYLSKWSERLISFGVKRLYCQRPERLAESPRLLAAVSIIRP